MKLILMLPLAVLSIQAAPLSYIASDCGRLDSQAYQDCQARMAASEAAFLASHTPDGIPWDVRYLDSLPPLPTIHDLIRWHYYFVLAHSEDSRWIVVGNHDEDTDSLPAYTWHDGTFTSAADIPHVDATGEGGWISINDQGTIAIGRGAWPAWLSPFGYLDRDSPSDGRLNDANQLLFRDPYIRNYLYEPFLFSAPEPSGFLLAGLGIAALLISARTRKSLSTRCTARPGPKGQSRSAAPART